PGLWPVWRSSRHGGRAGRWKAAVYLLPLRMSSGQATSSFGPPGRRCPTILGKVPNANPPQGPPRGSTPVPPALEWLLDRRPEGGNQKMKSEDKRRLSHDGRPASRCELCSDSSHGGGGT